jgi:hypothetical protein
MLVKIGSEGCPWLLGPRLDHHTNLQPFSSDLKSSGYLIFMWQFYFQIQHAFDYCYRHYPLYPNLTDFRQSIGSYSAMENGINVFAWRLYHGGSSGITPLVEYLQADNIIHLSVFVALLPIAMHLERIILQICRRQLEMWSSRRSAPAITMSLC